MLYKSTEIANRIRLTVQGKPLTLKKMLEDVGLGFNAMSHMNTSYPRSDNLAKIADYLDVSMDYLMGRTDNPNINR